MVKLTIASFVAAAILAISPASGIASTGGVYFDFQRQCRPL